MFQISASLPRERSECFGYEQRRVAVFQALPEGLERFSRLTALSLAYLEQPNCTRDASPRGAYFWG
ncbi:hypothetical protein ACFL2V_07525 [Pseudomonadota bacterium]